MPTLACALSGTLTIHSAAEQHALLRDALSAGTSTLDLAAITECDTAGVQLLLAAARRLHSQGAALELRHAGDAVCEVLRRYGLESLLATPARSGATA